jgi:hypothetical protein
LAKAKRKGYKEVVMCTVPIADHFDLIADDDKAAKRVKMNIRELNKFAYGDFILSMDTTIWRKGCLQHREAQQN